jgi:hypothetical protein
MSGLLRLPPGCTVRIVALGREVVIVCDPEGDGDLARLQQKGRIAGFFSLDEDCDRLDRTGQTLAQDLLDHGEIIAFEMSSLAEAFAFQSRWLKVAEAAQ